MAICSIIFVFIVHRYPFFFPFVWCHCIACKKPQKSRYQWWWRPIWMRLELARAVIPISDLGMEGREEQQEVLCCNSGFLMQHSKDQMCLQMQLYCISIKLVFYKWDLKFKENIFLIQILSWFQMGTFSSFNKNLGALLCFTGMQNQQKHYHYEDCCVLEAILKDTVFKKRTSFLRYSPWSNKASPGSIDSWAF